MTFPTNRNTAVLVLGMHRSGSSSVAGVLQRVGVDLGSNLMPPKADNPKGFFEHKDAVQIHDEVLMMLGSAWHDPSSLPSGWEREPRIRPLRDKLAAIIARDFAGTRLWGLKDPRLCRLLPLWLALLDEHDIDAKAILVVRDPREVSASLYKRNRINYEQSVALWLSNVLDSERYSRHLIRAVVIYDNLLSDWQREIERIRSALSIDLFAFTQETIDDVSSFLDGDLHHHRDTDLPALRAPQNAFAVPVYQSMVAWKENGTSPLDVCSEAFDQITLAERAAAPIVAYVRSKAEIDLRGRLHAESQADLEARRLIEQQLLDEQQAHAALQRNVLESAEREFQLRSDAEAALQAQLRAEAEAAREVQFRTEARALETQLRAEISVSQEAQARAETQTVREVQLRMELEAAREMQTALQARSALEAEVSNDVVNDLAAQILRYHTRVRELQTILRALQNSRSWRLTKPIRMAMSIARNMRSRSKPNDDRGGGVRGR